MNYHTLSDFRVGHVDLAQLADAEAKKKAGEKEKARVSTTDPDARMMKMGDGGFRPAFNGQFAVDTQSQVVLGVSVSNSGSDQGKRSPMVEQVKARYGEIPDEYLVDGGFAKPRSLAKRPMCRMGADARGGDERGNQVWAPACRRPAFSLRGTVRKILRHLEHHQRLES